MKTKLISLIISTILFVSCAGLSPKAKTFATLEATQTVVHNTMNEYGRLYRAGKVSVDTRTKVTDAHNSYRQAFEGALVAAEFNFQSATPENVRQLRDTLLSIVLTIKK